MNQIVMRILAQAEVTPPVGPDGVPVAPPDQSVPEAFFGKLPIDQIWNTIVDLSWLQAATCVAFAAIYLIYGWRVFRVLVVINFAMLGLLVGRFLGAKLGSPLWGGIVATSILGTVSWPFMKYCVSALGAVAGAVLGAAIWRAVTLPDPLIWCGALAGLIAGGLLAFSSFKVSIMLFTSLQGAVFLTIGVLAWLSDYPNLTGHVAEAVYSNVFVLPIFLIVPTFAGIMFQRRLLRLESDFAKTAFA